MMQYKMVLELFQKVHPLIYASQFIHDIINCPTFIYPIESGKCGKKEKKITTISGNILTHVAVIVVITFSLLLLSTFSK